MRAIRSDACGIDVSGLAEWIRVDELNRGRLHYPAGGQAGEVPSAECRQGTQTVLPVHRTVSPAP